MALEESNLSTERNPSNFPAKLWRLVNDPHYSCIQWDVCGEEMIIDEELFMAELVSPREAHVPQEVFKVSSFGSFVRQLNLYGFRKMAYRSAYSCQPVGDLRAGDRNLHRFCNRFFRRGHPELLVNLKRLTAFNKTKKVLGLKRPTRPPNRYQRPNPLQEQRMTENEVPVEETHRFSRHENIWPNTYAGPVFQSHYASPLVSTRMWPCSLGPHQRHLIVPSSFPEKPNFLPVMQQFPTAYAYALQSTAATLHVGQSHALMMESVHNNRSVSAVQYPNIYYPADGFQCYPAPYIEHLTHFSNPDVLLYQPYNYYQSPQMQAPFSLPFCYLNLPNTNYNDHGNPVTFDTAIQVIDGLQHSSQLSETLNHSQTNQLECALCVNLDYPTCTVRSYQAPPFLQT